MFSRGRHVRYERTRQDVDNMSLCDGAMR